MTKDDEAVFLRALRATAEKTISEALLLRLLDESLAREKALEEAGNALLGHLLGHHSRTCDCGSPWKAACPEIGPWLTAIHAGSPAGEPAEDLATQARRLLQTAALVDPKVRFQQMVESGLIDSEGRVLLGAGSPAGEKRDPKAGDAVEVFTGGEWRPARVKCVYAHGRYSAFGWDVTGLSSGSIGGATTIANESAWRWPTAAPVSGPDEGGK